MFPVKKYKKNVAKIYECPNSGDKFALIAINGNMKDKLLEKFQGTFNLQGNHVVTGGKASDLFIPSLLAGGSGALGISAATSGTLFMATANPATLMAIGNGVGSAVMGTGGIIAQAPFIPVAGALMPVVAPLLAFQALSAIMIIQQFNSLNERLMAVEKSINRVLQRNEATLIGEIFSTISRLRNLENEATITGRFTNDMMIRLALIENKVNPIFERYKYLYNAQNYDEKMTSEDLRYGQTDAYMAIVLSILDLRIDILRIKLSIQENPEFLKYLIESLSQKIEHDKLLWSDIENSPIKVEQVADSLKDAVSKMNTWQRHMPSWLGGKRDKRKELEQQEEDLSHLNSYSNTQDLHNAARDAMAFGELLSEKINPATLVYWEDKLGKHSYYTDDVMIK